MVAIILAAIACRLLGITVKAPPQLSAAMFGSLFRLDAISVITDRRALSVVLIFFIIDFFGGIGKFIGLTAATKLNRHPHLC